MNKKMAQYLYRNGLTININMGMLINFQQGLLECISTMQPRSFSNQITLFIYQK